MINKIKNIFFLITILIILFCNVKLSAIEKNLSWLTSAGNNYSHRFFLGDQINVDNIQNLEQVWIYNSGSTSISHTVQSPPIFVDNQLFLVTLSGDLISLSPKTGKTLWKKKLSTPLGRRGFTYHKSDNPNISGIYISSGENVFHLNKDGKILNKFFTGKSLLQTFVYKNKLYVSTLKQGVKALDIFSKKEIWSTNFKKGNVTPRVWSGFSFDEDTNSLFVVTSNPGGIIGKNRSGDDYSVSLISIDGNDGNIKWQYKHIINDVWDFDLISNPIILKNLKTIDKNDLVDSVIALSKTGDLIMVDIHTGEPIFDNSFLNINVEESKLENVKLSSTQKFYLKPKKFSNINVSLEDDFNHLDINNLEYIINKLRHAKSGFYIPPSLDYDTVMYGVHGGAEWPGATLYRDNEKTNLIIPSNKTPWIFRIQYQEKKYLNIIDKVQFAKNIYNFVIQKKNKFLEFFQEDNKMQTFSSDKSGLTKKNTYKVLTSKSVDTSFRNRSDINGFFSDARFKKMRYAEFIYGLYPNKFDNKIYLKNCSSCHGKARQGRYEHETSGDSFYPSLVGLTKTKKWISINSYEQIKKIHKINNINLKISSEQFTSLIKSFEKYDDKLFKDESVELQGFWQMLLDKDGLPATKPPWGYLTNINLFNGKTNWQIPFGERTIDKNKIIKGDLNFGGVISTKSKIIFANGTPDPFAYAYDLKSGEKIWQSKLPYSGSAPPMAFTYKGCDVIVFTATGGRFIGYKKNGDTTVAYKLKSCNFD